MFKKSWEVEPIETKESIFVMWKYMTKIVLFFKHVESWSGKENEDPSC